MKFESLPEPRPDKTTDPARPATPEQERDRNREGNVPRGPAPQDPVPGIPTQEPIIANDAQRKDR